VTRQVAQAAGNAAKTVQRMEEAIDRSGQPSVDLKDPEVLYEATSMVDLALKPKLAHAVENAENEAKRSFEVYGGKVASTEPPFGRVPKRAKIEASDFEMGLEFCNYKHARKAKAVMKILI
jgi:hypothetical protein